MDRKQTVVANFIWRFLERCGAQIVAFVVSVILARLLDPELYGIVALITVITNILQVFVDSGMATALIQKKDSDELDFSSVFFFNIGFCLILYAGLFFSAPLISRLYRNLSLTPLVRVLGLTVVVSGVKNVQQAYVSKTLQFKRFFFATLGGTLFSAAVGIFMAYRGFGVWALVVQQLLNQAVNAAILWLTVGWHPQLSFSFARLKGLISYGWKLLVSALMDTVYMKVRQLVVGLMYSSSDLAFYNKADQMPNLVVENINASIDSVLLPVLSSAQDSKSQVRDMTRRAIKISTYIMMPMMMGLAVCATPLIRLLLTEKWLPCVPYMRIFCLTYAFYPIHTANLNAIKAMGRSDIFLKLEFMKCAFSIVVLLVTMRFGVFAIALGQIASCIFAQLVNSWPNRALLDYSYLHQFKDMLPTIGLSCLMGACVWPVNLLGMNDFLTLLVQVPLGVAVFTAGSLLFKLDSFDYVLSIIKKMLRRSSGTV